MPTVYLYHFRGTFRATPEFDYTSPQPGATHDGLVFVRQDDETRDDAGARAACLRYGFADVEILKAGSIEPEALLREENASMRQYVQWAFAQGAGLMWYPRVQNP